MSPISYKQHIRKKYLIPRANKIVANNIMAEES